MERPQLEVAEAFRKFREEYLAHYGASLPPHVWKAINAIISCRTEALGGHILECDRCGNRQQSYNSCRNRSCPKCEGSKQAEWMEARAKDLLPVHYFHVVFTLPSELNHLLLLNQRECFELFVAAVRKTLLTVGKNNLKAKIGFFSILHTWGQALDFHPHIHCVIPGGGISFDGEERWIHSSKKKKYFVSQKVLALVFRGIFLRSLRKAYRQKRLVLPPGVLNIEQILNAAGAKKWVVHCKPPFGGPEAVLKYLSRYIHRIAIGNSRLADIDEQGVTFRYRDYADPAKPKVMHLSGVEFMRRFLMHIPPPKFVRIRHCGFLANKNRESNITKIRTLLKVTPAQPDLVTSEQTTETRQPRRCPCCGEGTMVVVQMILPLPRWRKDSS